MFIPPALSAAVLRLYEAGLTVAGSRGAGAAEVRPAPDRGRLAL